MFEKWWAKSTGQYVGLIFGVIAIWLVYEMAAFLLHYFEAEHVRHIKLNFIIEFKIKIKFKWQYRSIKNSRSLVTLSS